MSAVTDATSTNGASLFDAVSSGLLGLALSTIIAVIITVFLTFAIQTYLNRPKIKGKILNIIRLEWVSDKYGRKASFWIYVYLTNYHKNPIAVLDYEFEADFGNGYVKIERVYGDVSKKMDDVIPVADSKGNIMEFKNFGKHLLYKNAKPVRYGVFNHGFVMFAGDLSLRDKKMKKLRFTCIDVFNRRHVIESPFEETTNLNLLLELLDTSED